MSAPGRPKREYRSAQHEGSPVSAAARGGDGVPSPCVSVCEIIPGAGLCAGCFRTLDEIAVWSVLDAQDKRAVLAALPARRAAHGAAPPDPFMDADAKR